MRFWRRGQREPPPPEGVRIRHADGRVTDCTVRRDPDGCTEGMARWIAVPPEGTVLVPGADTVTIDVLPPRTSVLLVLPAQS